MDVAVVGGGIGGLSLALQLERAGIDCQVYESVPAYALGVGINLFPHASPPPPRAPREQPQTRPLPSGLPRRLLT
jgi:glycine/D-amino acid oxidase-like deaminating enzyme